MFVIVQANGTLLELAVTFTAESDALEFVRVLAFDNSSLTLRLQFALSSTLPTLCALDLQPLVSGFLKFAGLLQLFLHSSCWAGRHRRVQYPDVTTGRAPTPTRPVLTR